MTIQRYDIREEETGRMKVTRTAVGDFVSYADLEEVKKERDALKAKMELVNSLMEVAEQANKLAKEGVDTLGKERDALAAENSYLLPKAASELSNTWMVKKYGRLNKETWRDDLRAGFAEAFRVLQTHGVLIFKWNETQVPVSQVIALTDEKPAIWQRTGKADKTHWIISVKGASHE